MCLGTLLACHGDHDHESELSADEFFYDCEQRPDLTVFATDEAYVSVINAEAAAKTQIVDDDRAPRLQSPVSGSVLSTTTPPTFTVATAAASLRPQRGQACPRASHVFWTRMAQSLSPISTAYAHCPAVSGPLFLLRLTHEGETAPVYSALASVTVISPSANVWTKVMKGRAGQTLKLSIVRAVLSKGTVTEGPYKRSDSPTFSVAN
jgi:hypothetical protein